MKSGDVICILAKSPRPGKVKARLTEVLGDTQAALLARALLMDTIATALKIPRSETTIAFWPADSRANFEEIIGRFGRDEPDRNAAGRISEISLEPQIGSDIGESLKMLSQGFFKCGAGKIVFICSDNPLLAPEIVRTAFDLLKNNRVVIGPTFDGGYYLLGLSGLYPSLFENVAWGSSDIYRQMVEWLDADGQSWQELELFYDVDGPDELEQLCFDIDNIRLAGIDDICFHTEKFLMSLRK